VSQENVESTRAAFEAWNQADLDGWLTFLDPAVEFYPAGVFPDFDAVYRGHDGATRFWSALHEPWEMIHTAIEEADDDEDCVVVTIGFRATGRGSGAAVELRLATGVKLRDGLAVTMISKPTAEEAWEALRAIP
jgi:ketosteroid isomerase-like protein